MSKYGHRTGDWKDAIINKLGGEAAGDAFLRGELTVDQVAKQAVLAILNFISTATVSFTARPGDTVSEFFKTRDGLYVWDAFRNLMDETWLASTIQNPSPIRISYYDLNKSANDFQTEKEFEGNQAPFIFENFGVFLAVLAGLILAQWGGKKDGPLLDNGYANLFYVRIGSEVFTVHVSWSSVDRYWHVFASPRGSFEWDAGLRVFSSNEHLDA
ncbi:MAG: hypothetical protein HZA94_00295 [Candidatus Vogelbacteria bacterium]|nr:hypothetical protein [Candidatus Vogelbacteria bacterium]